MMQKINFKKVTEKINKRFAIATVVLCVIVSGTAYAEFVPALNQQHQSGPESTLQPTTKVSSSPSPIPSETPTTPPTTVQAPTRTSTRNNNNAQCQALIDQANADLNAQTTAIQAELVTYKAMITNTGSSPAQTIDGSGSTQGQIINQAGQQASLDQESNKLDQMESQFNTAKSNYQDELIGMGCPYTIGAQQ